MTTTPTSDRTTSSGAALRGPAPAGAVRAAFTRPIFTRPVFFRTAGALALAGLLAGCAPGQQPLSNRQIGGAAAGAAVGAGTGALIGDTRGALIGAGIGLLTGAAVGTFLDEQERRLQQDLQGTGADITRVDDALLVTLPGGVTFDTGSATVTQEFRRPLGRVAETLKAYPSSYVDIIGHTDSTGDRAFNQRLSEQRARSVSNVLVNRGVQRTRLNVMGRGPDEPIASNASAQGRAANRRVEIVIRPVTQN